MPSKKQSKKAVDPVPGAEHIVFGKGKEKTKTTNDTAEAPVPPRPDARKIIGGASWTGKLPVNLLSEHCQRQKWNRPDYSMRQMPQATDGEAIYRSTVTLSITNPKTKQTTSVPPFRLPDSHVHLSNQPTALEARHFAATYALFRVASMKNIHMTLPPYHKDLWKGEFSSLKDEDTKEGRGWKYDADPFAAQQKTLEIRADVQKREENKEKVQAKATSLGLLMPTSLTRKSKIWEHVPTVDLGQRLRLDIEGLVKEDSTWNSYDTRIPQEQQEVISVHLAKYGFRQNHIDEALQYCKNREETMEWLLIHVPEDDLPGWSFPPGYSAGVSLADGDLVKEGKLTRLRAAGYSSIDCSRALLEHGNDEVAAADALQSSLLPNHLTLHESTPEPNSDFVWEEEMTTLKAILDAKIKQADNNSCTVSLDLADSPEHKLRFIRPESGYPSRRPPIVRFNANLPAYVRLSATRQVLLYAYEHCVGDMMIFSMIEWIEGNLSIIIENPGLLRTLNARSMNGHSIESQNQHSEPGLAIRRGPQRHRARGNDQNMLAEWNSRQASPAQRQMMTGRQKLPAWTKQDDIVITVRSHRVTIISGETGSGKSTQSVQFILDDMVKNLHGSTVNVLCTQPRRISALGLSERVSQERCLREGTEVGYIIRGDSKVSEGTRITFMTTGVLLRRLQSHTNLLVALEGVSHIFVDEVHERNLDTDFLLALLRSALKVKSDLKLVLMSATLDAEVFSAYFGGSMDVGHVHIEGRTFPVEDFYLDDVVRKTQSYRPKGRYDDDSDDNEPHPEIGKAIMKLGSRINYDLIASLVRGINQELGQNSGGILIFLPGTAEIARCIKSLQAIPGVHALPLHASLLPSEQRRVFLAPPPGKRKVVAATNVAETSITIEDIVVVIDTGRVKETSYDPHNNIVRLEEVWASKAACKQRRGRAGRVRAGTCYKLFTRNIENSMAERPEPEIRRVPLEQLCLSVKAAAADRDIAEFLASTLTPPDTFAVENAVRTLYKISALEDGRLTALGTFLSMIPADMRCAKLLIYACIFGCLESCLTISAILTVRSPFFFSQEKREESKAARNTYVTLHGDLLLDLAAYDEWSELLDKHVGRRDVQSWCRDKFLSESTLRDISSNRDQLLDSLKDAGLVPLDYHPPYSSHAPLNTHNSNSLLLRGLISAALHPQTARIQFPDKKYIASISGAKELDPEAKTIKYFTATSSTALSTTTTTNNNTTSNTTGRVFIHPSSCLFDAQSYTYSAGYVSYFSKIATSKPFIRDLTPFNAYALLLFGGKIELVPEESGLVVDGWIRLKGWARIGVLVSRLRVLLDQALRRRFEGGGVVESGKGGGDIVVRDQQLLDVVRKLVVLNGQDQ